MKKPVLPIGRESCFFFYFPFSVIFLRCSIFEGNLTILDGGNDSQRVYIIACIPQLFAAALKFLFNDSRNAADGAACLLYKGAKPHGRAQGSHQ